MFNQLTEAVTWIETQSKFKPKTDLVRMNKAISDLKLSFKNTKLIHVAGTNGKGSVCSYLTQIFLEQGLSVGTYTSPYLTRFNERIRIYGNEISDTDLLVSINDIYEFNKVFTYEFGENLAFFELITLMAIKYFHKMQVQVMIMEVGLGGMLDATNVLDYDLSLITNIGFDHMKQLGNTLESIASNKLGILKPNNHLITTVDQALHPYFQDYIKKMNVTSHFIIKDDYNLISANPVSYLYQGDTYSLSLLGRHQVLNSILAIRAALYLYPDIDIKTIQNGLKRATWAGRLEMIRDQVYIDGAHNIHALQALKDTLSETFKDYKIKVLFSALGDKDIESMLSLINSFSNQVIITSFDDPRYRDLSLYGDQEMKYIRDFKKAYLYATSHMASNEILLITGSLHFIGFVKNNLKDL